MPFKQAFASPLALFALAASLGACSSGSDGQGGSDGGNGGSGGETSTGGALSGGTTGVGGANGQHGGATASGGTTGAGGNDGSSGAGATSNGGRASASGGTGDGGVANGGSSSGGANGTGGTKACTVTAEVSLNDSATGTSADQFDYQGSWDTSAAAEKYQGDDHFSSTTGDTATLKFEGLTIALHTAKASHHGIAQVTLDGGTPVDVDEYSATRADDLEVWKSGALSAGQHTLQIRVSGRKNDASTGTTVSLDRVVVERSACGSMGSGGTGNGSGGTGSGGKATGGTAGTGGKATGGSGGTGGNAGSGGSNGGAVKRPGYNT
ncbi:MAG TPA: hypothetical protein VHU80_09600, partial [Polyangiaceae bacterium]|nr:hypothetical protein [Polyangiaceae bacterium]